MYIVILFLSPSFASAILYFLTTKMHVTPMQFGVLGIVGSLGTVLAQSAVGALRIPHKISILWGTTLDTILTFIVVRFIHVGFPILAAQSFLGPISSALVGMPVLLRAGQIVEQYERKTLVYSICTAVMNVCGIASTELGGLVVGVIGAPVDLQLLTGLIAVQEAWGFLPMIFVWLL